jgi:hypothetical protein
MAGVARILDGTLPYDGYELVRRLPSFFLYPEHIFNNFPIRTVDALSLQPLITTPTTLAVAKGA